MSKLISSGVAFDDRSYTWDAAGNKIARVDNLGLDPNSSRSFTYDSAYRMVASTGFWGVVNYALDDVGNRVTVDRGPGSGTYTMSAVTPNPADHQMNQYTTTPRGQNVYDARGPQGPDGGHERTSSIRV